MEDIVLAWMFSYSGPISEQGGNTMRKALANVVVVTFVGLMCTSLVAVFSGAMIITQHSPHIQYQQDSEFS